jgi:hypothetical protein
MDFWTPHQVSSTCPRFLVMNQIQLRGRNEMTKSFKALGRLLIAALAAVLALAVLTPASRAVAFARARYNELDAGSSSNSKSARSALAEIGALDKGDSCYVGTHPKMLGITRDIFQTENNTTNSSNENTQLRACLA